MEGVTEVSRAVLVTGCSSGIGRAVARTLARSGWTVYASARRPESVAGLAEEGCRPLALDVTDEESRVAAVDAVIEAEGAVGVLINNAGYSQSGALETVPLLASALTAAGLGSPVTGALAGLIEGSVPSAGTNVREASRATLALPSSSVAVDRWPMVLVRVKPS